MRGIFEGIRAYNGRVFKLKDTSIACSIPPRAILLQIPLSHAK